MKNATICYLMKDGKVALSLKKIRCGKGFLNGYGGKVKDGETPEIAAARELFEEAGVTVDPANPADLQKVAVIDFFDGDKPVFRCHVFFAKKWKGEPVESDEMTLPEWFAMDSVPYDR